MKKRLFIAAAMAIVALVGCQKEFAPVAGSEQRNNAGLDQRPVLANAEMTIGGLETRATVGSNNYDWKYEAGDQVGAVLVDEVQETAPAWVKDQVSSDPTDFLYSVYAQGGTMEIATTVSGSSKNVKYKFTDTYTAAYDPAPGAVNVKNTGEAFYKINPDYIYSNYPYKTEDGKSFKTPATLVEGNYMFYAPYNAGNGTRGPLVATLPAVQEVGEEGNEAIVAFYKGKTPVVLALNYLSAAETSTVNPTPAHIFAYPQFTIVNKYNGFLFDGKSEATGVEVGGTSSNKYFLSTDVAATYTMTIKEIEFYTGTNATDNIFAPERKINPDELKKVEDWAGGKTYRTTATSVVAQADGESAFDFGKDVPKTASFDNDLATAKEKAAHRIVVPVNYELEYGDSYSFQVVMPGEDYTEAGLFARVLVTIDGKDYYIVSNEVTGNTYNKDGKIANMNLPSNDKAKYYGYAYAPKSGFGTVNDYQFADRHNRGSKDIVLVRGNRYPVAETKENADGSFGVKDFKGELLTIELVGGQAQVALAAATEETIESNGIKNNAQLLAFLEDKAHNSAKVEEVEDASEVENENTQFYLAEENTVIIDADVIAALQSELWNDGTFTLKTNLPIDANVVVSGSDKEYTFTAGEASFTISYETAPNAYTSNKVGAGINRVSVSSDTELKMADDAANAVVFVDSDNVTLKDPTGINGIVVADGKALKVAATADVAAWVVAGEEAVVDVQAGSKGLINPNNNFEEGTVNNQALATINGDAGVVTYSRNGFGTEAIPAATQINKVTIDAASQNATLPVETASFDYFKNLKAVTVVFGSNIKVLESAAATVTVGDNIIAVEGTATWDTTDKISGTTVSFAKGVNPTVQEGDGVKFTNRN